MKEKEGVFTSGVSKMRLTCMGLVMCQVYLEKEPRGSPSFLTNADVHTQTDKERVRDHKSHKMKIIK